MINRTPPNINDPIVNRAFQETYKLINELFNAVNKPQTVMGRGDIGKSGDIQFIAGEDNSGYLLVKGKDGYYSTFEGCFASFEKTPKELHLKNLTVDNLFAKTFIARQINAQNGDVVYSDMGEVDHIAGDDVFFKEATNLNLCSFAVNDLIVARRLAMDKSLDIKYVKGTVTAVSGNKVTVTYEDANKFAKGDIVVRVGNTTDTTRQDNIYVCTNLTGSPYIDINDGIASFANWDAHAPTVRIGKLTEIVDSNFNPVAPYKLSGYGLYAENVYLKGKLQISSNADIIGLTIPTATYSSGDTFPVSPVEGDWHFYTGATGGGYTKNCWYRYSGSAWGQYGLTGTYIDGTGVYTGTVVASQVIAGTLTGFTIQTSATGKRVLIDTGDTITFYNSNNDAVGSIEGYYSTPPAYSDLRISATSNMTISATSLNLPTVVSGTFSTGCEWTATPIADSYISSASTWNAKESALTFSSPLSRATNTISIPVATSSANGYLSSTDWSTFNGKSTASFGSTASYTWFTPATVSTQIITIDGVSLAVVTGFGI